MHVPSLRQLARHLHYAISSLYEAKSAGHFVELSTGGYDLAAVAQGLLDNSSPRTPERRELLERLARSPDAAVPQRKPRQPSADALLDPRTERAIAASTQPSMTPEALEALDLLAHLPRLKMAAFHAVVPIADTPMALSAFRDAVVAMLDERIEQIEQGDDDESDDETGDDPQR
jgi:hypothetical protein